MDPRRAAGRPRGERAPPPQAHRGIVANPNCSTIQLVCALKPLHDAAAPRATSRSPPTRPCRAPAARAVDELRSQSQAVLEGARRPAVRVPSSDRVQRASAVRRVRGGRDAGGDASWCARRTRSWRTTRSASARPACACRSGASHSEAVWIETERPLDADEARELLERGARRPGGRRSRRPPATRCAIEAAGGDDVLVGRIRARPRRGPTGWRSGSSPTTSARAPPLNGVQIAELLVERDLLRVPEPERAACEAPRPGAICARSASAAGPGGMCHRARPVEAPPAADHRATGGAAPASSGSPTSRRRHACPRCLGDVAERARRLRMHRPRPRPRPPRALPGRRAARARRPSASRRCSRVSPRAPGASPPGLRSRSLSLRAAGPGPGTRRPALGDAVIAGDARLPGALTADGPAAIGFVGRLIATRRPARR